MNCPNCGKEVNDNQNFCTTCGAEISSNTKNDIKFFVKYKRLLVTLTSLLLLLLAVFGIYKMIVNISQSAINTPASTLAKIDKYQEQYFKIIKRNNMFLQLTDYDNYNKDQKELSDLYKMVENQIDPDCVFFKKHKLIELIYAENTGGNTVEMNEFASEHYNAVDKLLNDTYKSVKTNIPQEDFNNLIVSEKKWLKEVEDYRKIYEQQDYGSIGNLVFSNYQVNMRKFRTLLLMLYLTKSNDSANEVYNIAPINSNNLEDKSTYQLLNMLIQEDNILSFIIENVQTQRTDTIFGTFYENLQKIISKISIDDLNITYEEDGTPIISPNTEIISFNGGIEINDDYLNKKYSNYLGNAWKKYLNLSRESKMHDINSGMSTNSLELVDEIVAWQAFLNNNPNFILANKIKKNIKTETLEIMYHNYIFAYTEDGSMSEDGRKGYEKFLKKVNQNTEEYNAVKKCYDELQSHGFQGTKEFYRLLYEYGQDSWYKELYDEVLVAN